MEIEQNRIFCGTEYTISRIFVDGRYFCDAVEDTDRGLVSTMSEERIRAIKVKGRTAIPRGRYQITIDTVSPKFSQKAVYKRIAGKLPRFIGVKGFDGVLVHIGNSAADTEGCVLVGNNTVKGRVTNSTETFFRLYALMQRARAVNEPILWHIK